MINFKFDDKVDIERKLLDNYANHENPEETIRELARYNHHILGMKKEDNYDAILAYMSKNCKDFYEEKYFSAIYRNIASAKKYKFRNVAPVVITRSELDKITSLNDIRKEIEEKLSSKIDLQLFVNPKLLGGFSLTVDGKQFDASFSKQITKLKKEFNKNIYERIF